MKIDLKGWWDHIVGGGSTVSRPMFILAMASSTALVLIVAVSFIFAGPDGVLWGMAGRALIVCTLLQVISYLIWRIFERKSDEN